MRHDTFPDAASVPLTASRFRSGSRLPATRSRSCTAAPSMQVPTNTPPGFRARARCPMNTSSRAALSKK